MEQTRLTIEGDHAVLSGRHDAEWLESDAVVTLEDWI